MTQIVGLVGFKQSGKSTAATYLEEKYGFARLNFKDGLIREIKQNFPDLLRVVAAEENMTIDELFTMKPPVIRTLMQNYGTEVVRKQNPDHWVLQWKLAMIDLVLSGQRNIVVDDVRFTEELKAIKGANGITIRLTRKDVTTGGNHQSETEHLKFKTDYHIHTKAGEFDKLYNELDNIIANYVKP